MVAYLYLQADGVPHVKNLVTFLLDSTSTTYARMRDRVLLALRSYALDAHVLSDTHAWARDPTWQRCDSIAMSWISGTISLDLQDIVRTPDPIACVMWLSLETQFLGNAQTRALQLDAELHTLEQGDLSVSDYCGKMKSTADGLRDLGFTVPEHILVLNVLGDLPNRYEAVRTLLTHQQPPPTFLQVRDALTLEELTRGHHTPASTTPSSSTSRALVTAPPPSSASPPASPWCSSAQAERGWGAVGGVEEAVVGSRDAYPGSDPLTLSSRKCALTDLLPPVVRAYLHVAPPGSRRRASSPAPARGHGHECCLLYAPTWTPPPPPSSSWPRGGGIRLPWRNPSALWG
jgi:hypothetical protein